MAARRSRLTALLFVVALLLVNLPLAHSTWTRHQVASQGVDAQAVVKQTRNLGTQEEPSWWVSYVFDEELDPDQREWYGPVDRATYDAAKSSGEITVRVLPDDPAANRPVGAVDGSAGLIGTLVIDAVLLLCWALLWRFRGRSKSGATQPIETVEALDDVTLARPGAVWEEHEGGVVKVAGEVVTRDEHEVVLDLGERLVRVVLDGHANHVGYQQPGQVRVRRLPDRQRQS